MSLTHIWGTGKVPLGVGYREWRHGTRLLLCCADADSAITHTSRHYDYFVTDMYGKQTNFENYLTKFYGKICHI